MLALLLLLLQAQAPVAPQSLPTSRPAAVVWSDVQARQALAALRRIKPKDSLHDRLQAVEALAVGSNRLLVPALAKIVAEDPALAVRRAAARALADQPAKEAYPAMMRLLADKAAASPQVAPELIGGIDRIGYEKRDWKLIEKLFDEEFDPKQVPVQLAILHLVIAHKEPQAIPLLLRLIDEPKPQDPDAPGNPPAEFWERRWKAWQSWRKDVVEALFVITGQRFSSSKEAKAWLDANGDKLKERRG